MTILEFLDKWVRGRYGPADVKAIARDLRLLEGVGVVPEGAPEYVQVAVAQIDEPHEGPYNRPLTFREEEQKLARARALKEEADRLEAERNKMLGRAKPRSGSTPPPLPSSDK